MNDGKIIPENIQIFNWFNTIWIPILVGLFSGVVGSLIGAYSSSRIERLRIIIKSLEDQLKYFYGPIMYYVVENQEIFSFIDNLMKQYKKATDKNRLSKDDADSIIKEENKLCDIVKENNKKIVDIIENKFNYIDIDDIELVSQFVIFYRRSILDFDGGKLNMPLPIYKNLGPVSFMRPEFIEKMKYKFEMKKNEIYRLQKNKKSGAQKVPINNPKKA